MLSVCTLSSERPRFDRVGLKECRGWLGCRKLAGDRSEPEEGDEHRKKFPLNPPIPVIRHIKAPNANAPTPGGKLVGWTNVSAEGSGGGGLCGSSQRCNCIGDGGGL